MTDEAEELRLERDRLCEALQPFAAISAAATRCDPAMPDDTPAVLVVSGAKTAGLLVGDLRRAAEAVHRIALR